MDVQQTALLGQHALTYVLVVYFSQRFSRRMMWFSPLTQALQLLPVFAAAHVLQMLIRMLAGGMFPGFSIALAPVLEMVLWPLVSAILLAPQRRAPDADSNPSFVRRARCVVSGVPLIGRSWHERLRSP